jgi:hypothetical protein
MRHESNHRNLARVPTRDARLHEEPLHPAWRAFIEYCAELKHGEIETLKIQDGVPVLAEVVKKKVKFAP